MSATFKVLLAAFLFAGFFTQERTCEHDLGFGPVNWYETAFATESNEAIVALDLPQTEPHSINTFVNQGDQQCRGWALPKETREAKLQFVKNPSIFPSSGPIEVDWRVLINIEYKLKYFKELDMEMYSPIFSEAVQALHGKEVVIKGYVIPFDEEEELLSLSFNPYASCFFCGKASPASVISMYLKDEKKRYKMDDFLKFKGTLYLNQDDPNEFYYILRDAEEV